MFCIGASVLLALAAGLCFADVHLEIPSHGDPPLYLSSTNARISARAWLTSPSERFESFELLLNGESVYYKWFNVGEGQLHSSWRAHVMFDSTHWGTGTTSCMVALRVKERGSPERTARLPVPIKNRAAGYILSHFVAAGDSLAPTMDVLEAMGYVNQAEVSSPGWTAAQCLGDIAGSTIFYVASHGHYIQPGKSYFTDGTAGANEVPPGTPVYSLVAPGSSNEVKPAREAAVGANLLPSQLPPFNPTGNPPIAFAFVDACNTSIPLNADEFYKAFCYPEQNKYRPEIVEDQAEMGWAEQVPNAILPIFTTKFWSELSLGKTVAQARSNALSHANSWHQAKYDTPFVYSPGLLGDEFTRLKHVYTGTNHLPPVLLGQSPWFRVVTTGTEGW